MNGKLKKNYFFYMVDTLCTLPHIETVKGVRMCHVWTGSRVFKYFNIFVVAGDKSVPIWHIRLNIGQAKINFDTLVNYVHYVIHKYLFVKPQILTKC